MVRRNTARIDEKDIDKPVPKLKRDNRGRILPGQQSLNPGGRPRDLTTAQSKLWKAIKKISKEKDKDGKEFGNFLEHYIRQAYKDKSMAIALLKKIVPDLKAVEIDKNSTTGWNVLIQSFANAVKNGDENEDS